MGTIEREYAGMSRARIRGSNFDLTVWGEHKWREENKRDARPGDNVRESV
jgi:hypothetical protein